MAGANRASKLACRSSGRDTGVTEVIAYVFMFAIGAIALVVAMNVMTETQEDSQDVASGVQVKQTGQIYAAHIQEAARVARVAPNATYNLTFEIPTRIGNTGYNATIEAVDCTSGTFGGAVNLTTDNGEIETSVPLGKTGRIQIDGTCVLSTTHRIHSSAGRVTVQYTNNPPEIKLIPAR